MPSSNVCWGVEVGSGAVKAMKLERDGESVRVVDFVVIPHKRVLSTPDIDQAEATRLALGALTAQFGDDLKSHTVAMSVPGHAAFARFAKLPPVEQKGVANLVRFEAVQQIPFPIEDVEWDYQTFMSEDSPDIEVGIFAITRERINDLLNLWNDAGISPDHVTLSPVALYNAVAYDLAFTQKTPGTIILDIGTMSTDLIVAEAGKVWIRTFPLGGHHFTEALASTFKLAYGKAERTKREVETSKHKRHILQALKPVLADLVQDVQRSISYYEDTHPDANLSRLVGVGSSFRLFGLRKLLSQQLQLDVYRLDQFKRISVEGPGASDFQAANLNLGTAYGLALQGLGFNAIDANLVPVEVVRTSMWRRKTPWFAAAAVLGLAGASLTFLGPFADSNAIAEARNDNEVKRVIGATIELGKRLKRDADALASDATLHPSQDASRIRALTNNRDLFPHLMQDLYAIFDGATVAARRLPEHPTGAVFTLAAYETAFVPPETGLTTGAGTARSAPGTSAFPGMPGEETPTEAPATPTDKADKAGPNGAVLITLTIETPESVDLPFLYDTVLHWLHTNADRAAVPYRIVNVSSPEEVAQSMKTETIAPDGKISAPASTAPDSRPSEPDRRGDPRSGRSLGGGGAAPPPPTSDFSDPGFDSGGGGGGFGMPGGQPASGGTPATVNTEALDSLAPLPPRTTDTEPRTIRKYTIKWVAYVRRPAPTDNAATTASAE